MKIIFALLLSMSSPIWAQTPLNDSTILPTGQSMWIAQPNSDPIKVIANLNTQMAYVYQDEVLIGVSSISSGRDGYETPTGDFFISGKELLHQSKKYKAPMPFTQWFTNTGVALHAGGNPGNRSSHGCIHLPRLFAQQLYRITHVGDEVIVRSSEGEEEQIGISSIG